MLFSRLLTLKGTVMKSARIFIAILTIILAPLSLLQSCAVSVGNAITDTQTDAPSVGALLSFIFMFAGIVGLSTKKYRTGNIITGAMFFVTAMSVYGAHDQIAQNFPDLIFYGWLSLFAAIVYICPSNEKAEPENVIVLSEKIPAVHSAPSEDLSAKLEKLFALKEKGILSQQEFDEQKAALLKK